MRSWSAALLLIAACSGSAPPASPAAPADPVASAASEPPPPAPSPDEPAERDPREIGFVSAQAAYRSGGSSVYRDLSDADEQRIADCFDRTMPLDQRSPVVYYVRVVVPNPDADPDQMSGFGGGGADSGIGYPEAGTYPAFEACVRDAFPSYAAPSDVTRVELRLHVYTEAQAVGTMGRGGAP